MKRSSLVVVILLACCCGIFFFIKKQEWRTDAGKKTGSFVRFDKYWNNKKTAKILTDHHAVSSIVSFSKDTSVKRLQQVHKLPNDLTLNDRLAIAVYLKTGPNNDIEYVIKNDLMNKLRNQKKMPPELTNLLIDLFKDKEQDIVVRIYALQHLRPQYEETKEESIKNIFYEALEERNTEVAGGALLALRYLATEYPQEFDMNLIAAKTVEILKHKDTYILTRISAIQVAAMLKVPEAENTIRNIAVDAGQPLILRIAAIAGIGDIGAVADLEILETLKSAKGPISRAASVAIVKINKKI